MPRIQVYLPDDLYRHVKRRGMAPSELLQAAVRAEIERTEKIAELDRYLAEVAPRAGKPSAADKASAKAVVARVKRHLQRGTSRRAS